MSNHFCCCTAHGEYIKCSKIISMWKEKTSFHIGLACIDEDKILLIFLFK